MSLKSAKKCRALVLEGGGDKGSYEVGVLKAFVEFLPAEEVMYDVITGVSVGSINAMAIALHQIGDEPTAINWMLDLWGKLTSSNIYNNWPMGAAQGIFFEEGLWNNLGETDYLNKTFEEFTDRKIYRKVNLNTVDFDDGTVYQYHEDYPFDGFAKAVTASTSMPFAFPHTHLDNHTFVDGGTIWNVDLSGAVERCREVVDRDEDIIVDTILCNGAQNITRDEHLTYNTIANFQRYQQISAYYGALSDYDEVKREYPFVNFRYKLVPESDLPSGFLPLGFVHKDIEAMIEIGYEEGKKAIQEGPDAAIERMRTFVKKTKDYDFDLS